MGRMILNGTVYGAGAKVEANPSETATDTLQTVDIDGVIYDIQGGGGGGTEITLIQNAEIYSTTEKQIGVWIDGKPLYKKTIDVTGSFSGEMVIDTLDMSSIDKIVKAEMMGLNETTVWRPIPNTQYHSSVDIKAGYFIQTSNGTINLRTGNLTAFSEIVFTMVYTKTTDAAGSGGYQAWGFSPIIYSTEEREVGVWIDNKPLYAKTITFSEIFILGSSNQWYKTTIQQGNEEQIIKVEGTNIASTYSTAYSGLSGAFDEGVLQLLAHRYSELNSVTIYYTKTTDVAGSGSYNTLGVPNVHYSTDEQVIGTWFGKSLYQKCYDNLNITVQDNKWNNLITISNGQDCIKLKVWGEFSEYFEMIPTTSHIDSTNGQLEARFTGLGADRIVKKLMVQYTKTTD